MAIARAPVRRAAGWAGGARDRAGRAGGLWLFLPILLRVGIYTVRKSNDIDDRCDDALESYTTRPLREHGKASFSFDERLERPVR